MSGTRFVIDGLEELREAMRQLPEDLARDAVAIVDNTGELVKASLIQVYPLGATGHLRRGVSKTTTRGRFGAVSVVTSRAPHAHLWEFGTQVRHTSRGWNRGQMPSHTQDGLIAIGTRERRKMNGQLIALVERAGFEVTGSV